LWSVFWFGTLRNRDRIREAAGRGTDLGDGFLLSAVVRLSGRTAERGEKTDADRNVRRGRRHRKKTPTQRRGSL
jgi:hypothetical protein